MRVDFQAKTVDGAPMPGPPYPWCRVVDLDTGEEIRDCFLADDRTGEYGRYLRNGEGAFYCDPARPREAAYEYGVARLRIEGFTWRDLPPLL